MPGPGTVSMGRLRHATRPAGPDNGLSGFSRDQRCSGLVVVAPRVAAQHRQRVVGGTHEPAELQSTRPRGCESPAGRLPRPSPVRACSMFLTAPFLLSPESRPPNAFTILEVLALWPRATFRVVTVPAALPGGSSSNWTSFRARIRGRVRTSQVAEPPGRDGLGAAAWEPSAKITTRSQLHRTPAVGLTV